MGQDWGQSTNFLHPGIRVILDIQQNDELLVFEDDGTRRPFDFGGGRCRGWACVDIDVATRGVLSHGQHMCKFVFETCSTCMRTKHSIQMRLSYDLLLLCKGQAKDGN